MCGIILVYQNKELGRASKRAFNLYQAQIKRGTQGYGCVMVDNNKVDTIYRSQYESGIKKIMSHKGNMALFHHRTPTSTPNLEECTHPMFISNEKLEYDYYVIHNGVISNAEELRKKYEALGFEYNTVIKKIVSYKSKHSTYEDEITEKFNDTESFAIDLVLSIEGGKKALDSKGSIAFIALQVEKTTEKVVNIFFGRNSRNPLKIVDEQSRFILSSDGDGKEVVDHTLFCYDPKTKSITQSFLDIDGYLPPRDNSEDRTPSNRKLFDNDDYKRSHMGFLPQGSRANNKTILDSQIRIKISDGITELIQFQTQGDYIYKTNILVQDADKLYLGDWRWYKRILSEMEIIVGQIKCLKKSDLPSYKSRLIDLVKKRAQEFKTMSKAINSRSYKTVSEGREVIIK